MSKTITLFFLLFYMACALGQNHPVEDSTATLSFIDKIMIKVNVDTQSDSYTVQQEGDSEFRLSTNNQYRVILSLDYEFIGASIGFAPTFLPENNDDDLRGKSSFTDYRFRFFLGNWAQTVQYRRVQGFYVENTRDFFPGWVEGVDPYIQFEDFKNTIWGGSTSYVLNPKFSLRNVVYNTEWQRKSAGSFVPTLRYGFSRISATLDGLKSYENSYDIRAAADYYYTWVIGKNWFVSPYLSPSFGIRFSKEGEEGSQVKNKNIYYPLALDGGLQLGFSSRRVIFGANLNFESTWYNEDEQTNVINDKVYAKVYFGYRFNPPGFVKRSSDWINKKTGL